MEVIINNKGTAHQTVIIKDIEGDMGEDERLQMLQQPDGDVVLTLYNPEKGVIGSIEFCSGGGGGGQPFFTKKLRECMAALMEKQTK